MQTQNQPKKTTKPKPKPKPKPKQEKIGAYEAWLLDNETELWDVSTIRYGIKVG